ncbi:hypothetical protein MX572_25890 (plasmid) [Rhodococcus pyridinivorans]|uniref:hypothetical protein n=1 Tax=Rhodococcus pyridinivorans TaxID=103816 RepID=UPI0020C69417|nr:hypothetical protein [Rhodococcus pyridinivorans]UTM40081.1 hypothetical protein MX572_25890 [Rhodococcus pyridinivorans]
MSVTDEIDAAVAAAAGGLDVLDPDVRSASEGPCSPEEARALISKAIDAADTFQSTMRELFRRRAHEALGYPTPREMLLGEFKGSLINPRTGAPYGDSHVHRMARVAWLTWAVAERTGVDMTELAIPERPLREISPGVDRAGDRDLVDRIADRVADVARSKRATADDVSEVIDEVINEAAGRTPRRERDPDDTRPEVPEGNFTSIQGEGEFGGRAVSPRNGSKTGFDDDVDGDYDDGAPGRPAGSGRVPAGTGGAAADAFGDPSDFVPPTPPGMADGALLDMGAAMAALREHGDFVRTLEDINAIGERLPTVTAVRDKLPDFLDAVDDSELHSFKQQLVAAREFIDNAIEAKRAVDAVLEETEFRIDDLY